MNLPSDMKNYEAPRDPFQWLDDAVAFLSLIAIALLMLAFGGLW